MPCWTRLHAVQRFNVVLRVGKDVKSVLCQLLTKPCRSIPGTVAFSMMQREVPLPVFGRQCNAHDVSVATQEARTKNLKVRVMCLAIDRHDVDIVKARRLYRCDPRGVAAEERAYTFNQFLPARSHKASASS